MIEISLEEAYSEACRALGEAVVRERVLTSMLAEIRSGRVETPGIQPGH